MQETSPPGRAKDAYAEVHDTAQFMRLVAKDKDFFGKLRQTSPERIGSVFLEKIGMAHLAPEFKKHRIGGAQAIALTERDIEHLTPIIGDQIRLREALAPLRKLSIVQELNQPIDDWEDILTGCSETTCWLCCGSHNTRFKLTTSKMRITSRDRFVCCGTPPLITNTIALHQIDDMDLADLGWSICGGIQHCTCKRLGRITVEAASAGGAGEGGNTEVHGKVHGVGGAVSWLMWYEAAVAVEKEIRDQWELARVRLVNTAKAV